MNSGYRASAQQRPGDGQAGPSYSPFESIREERAFPPLPLQVHRFSTGFCSAQKCPKLQPAPPVSGLQKAAPFWGEGGPGRRRL